MIEDVHVFEDERLRELVRGSRVREDGRVTQW